MRGEFVILILIDATRLSRIVLCIGEEVGGQEHCFGIRLARRVEGSVKGGTGGDELDFLVAGGGVCDVDAEIVAAYLQHADGPAAKNVAESSADGICALGVDAHAASSAGAEAPGWLGGGVGDGAVWRAGAAFRPRDVAGGVRLGDPVHGFRPVETSEDRVGEVGHTHGAGDAEQTGGPAHAWEVRLHHHGEDRGVGSIVSAGPRPRCGHNPQAFLHFRPLGANPLSRTLGADSLSRTVCRSPGVSFRSIGAVASGGADLRQGDHAPARDRRLRGLRLFRRICRFRAAVPVRSRSSGTAG